MRANSVLALALRLTALAACFSGAQADDLLTPPSAEFGRACSAYGSGFVALTGTETCVRVGGRVRVDAGVTGGGGQASQAFRSRSSGSAAVETLTQTDLGLIRTYLDVQVPVGEKP